MFSVIKHRNNQQQNQGLNHKSSHIEREQVTNVKFGVNTVKINRESDHKNDHH